MKCNMARRAFLPCKSNQNSVALILKEEGLVRNQRELEIVTVFRRCFRPDNFFRLKKH